MGIRRGDGWAGIALLAGVWIGSGWLNGDAAAYCAQGWSADATDRWTHVGYVALAVILAPVAGPELPLALDGLGVLAAVVAAMAAGRLGGPVAAIGSAAVLIPWAPFAEVDPLWIAAVVASAAGIRGGAAFGVAVSPVALLALPWAAIERRSAGPLIEGLVAVGVLIVVSQGEWLVGERGLLVAPAPRPWRTLAAWGSGIGWPLLILGLCRPAGPARALGLGLLLAAPPDVPGWVLGGIAIAIGVGRQRSSVAPAVVALQLGLGAWSAEDRSRRVRAEAAIVTDVAAALVPGDGLVAPWTWGARVAVARTGDPYGIPWHPPEGWLRDQQAVWCASAIDRLVILPPPVRTTPVRRSPCP